MVLKMTWVRNDMLLSNNEYEKQLVDAEWKVQRSLQKSPTSNWNFNKCSNSAKILSVAPIESRKNPALNWASFSLLDTSIDQAMNKDATIIIEKDNNKCSQRKSPKIRRRRSAPKLSSAKHEVLNLPKNICKTVSKQSPPTKTQNIDIFPCSPRIQSSKGFFEDGKIDKDDMYKTFLVKKQSDTTYQKADNNSNNKQISGECIQKENNFLLSEMDPIYQNNIHEMPKLKIFPTPTSKFSPSNFFSSTTLEETLKINGIPSNNILEKSSFFENVSRSRNVSNNTTTEFGIISRARRRMSQSVLEKTFIFEANSKGENNPLIYKKTPLETRKINWLAEKNMQSIESITIEKDNADLSLPRSTSMVRDIVNKMEVCKKHVRIPEKEVQIEAKCSTIDGKRSNFDKKVSNFLTEERKTQSPYSKFLNSKKKSMELENMVQSKQPQREKSLVRGIIETLMEKMRKSSPPRENRDFGINQNFVKKLVRALEKEDTTEVENSLSERISVSEEGSFSESETKFSFTSASLEDTDSNNDSDLGSLSPTNDDDQKFTYCNSVTKKMGTEQKILQDDDSVYWIPVSKCELPRSSTLLSMMSRLSSNTQSPCISPVRSESEDAQLTSWRTSFKKTNDISRKLFKIDETVIIDSGYSDRSDRSDGSPVSSVFARSRRSYRR